MDMIIAILVLAGATTVSFMSFVTLKKQIDAVREENRAHWKSVEYSLEVQSNQLSKEIQISSTFNDNAFVAINENITATRKSVTEEVIAVVEDCDEANARRYVSLCRLIKDTTDDTSKNVTNIVKNLNDEVVAEIKKSTRDINFITQQQAGRVITTPLRVMWEQAKVEVKRGNEEVKKA